ncbi:MAG TPA: DNA polymerase III subunit alpha [Gemmatimonadaceae bacterium]|nr:DNA polymerase III subunit alpha [Gemmatimonadaceae bacterium]
MTPPRRASGAVPYVELRAHSAFSFGDGAATPEALAARAALLGYPALGLTDTADLGGVVRFALAAERAGIRPVVGAELVVDGHPAAFLVRSAEGYRNLAALVTRARCGQVEAWTPEDAGARAGAPPRGRPGVTWADVAARSAGLIALTGPATGPLAALLAAGQPDVARQRLRAWRDVFGEWLAVEVQLHGAGRREEALAGALVALAEEAGVPWVVTNDPRYLDRAGRLAHDVLTALRAGLDLETAAARGVLLPNGGWRLRSPAAMAARWAGRTDGLTTSLRIAEACDFRPGWVRPPLPRFAVPAGHTDDSFLRQCVEAGARERWGSVLIDRQRDQLEHELAVIARLGFAGFFLVMWDAVRTAHARGILAQGRGSAANSAVAYCLGITAVDPVRHGLLFERFLSEARTDGLTEAPDIDVDFEHDRREEVLDYVYGRYERSKAAITCIVQTYRAPNAVQDVLRAFGHPPDLAVALSKRLHHVEPAEGAAVLRDGLAAAHGLDVTTPRGAALLAAVAAFEELPRLRATHPGGFVLSSAPLGDYCPIEPTTMGRTVIQFDKDDLDAVGIPKFDFLGLGSLAAVRRAFDVIELRTGTRPTLYGLPPDDPATFRMIARGDTMGTFQIESRAQIASLVHTKPERLYDIVVQVALIRPGPIVAKFVRPYTDRRRGRAPVVYPPGLAGRLGPILDRTQGIPIFQEQAMAMAMELAHYSAAEADELRRTMGHQRKAARLAAALERLRARMVDNGIAEPVAAQLADDLRSFGNYGFPESHAWSFAIIAYATAWLKAHEPAAFYCGLLNAWPMGFYAPSTLVHDARRHGVEVRPPCLAAGRRECTVEETDDPARPALRIGWRFVRGMGPRTLERLAHARAGAPFASIADVAARAALTRADALALARAGALAAWEPDRRRAAWAALRVVGDTLPLAPAGTAPDTPTPDTPARDTQALDAALPDAALPDAALPDRADPDAGYAPRALRRREAIALDYHAVGLSVTGHPMERYRAWLRRLGAIDSAELARCRSGELVIVAGLVSVRQRPTTAKGTLFLLLEDEQGTINVIVANELVEANREAVRHSPVLAVYGRAERSGALVNVVGRKFRAIAAEAVTHRSHDFR